MRTLSISISDNEFDKFGFKKDNLAFPDLIKLVRKELTRENLNKCLELAEKHGLSTINMEEISDEVRAVRQNAKGNN